MHCPHCGKSVDAGDAHCRHCGGALGASSSAALEALVENKARAILAEERAAEQRAAEEERRRVEIAEAARRAEEQAAAAEKERRDDESMLTTSRARLEVVAATRRPFFAFRPIMLAASVLIAMVLGLPAGCIGECVSRRPMWGSYLCPGVCSDCQGPGVIQTWHSSGSGGDSDHMGAYCHNGHVDVNAKEFWFLAVDGKAEDIEISWWKRNGLSVGVLALFLLLPMPFFAARARRRALDREASRLEDHIAALETKRARAGGSGGSYR